MERESLLHYIYTAHQYLRNLESSPRDYGTGDVLYSSDIHTVTAIEQHPGANLTQLAEYLDVSKAAVSKFTSKMLKLGYITKNRPAANAKEVIFHLTGKGKAAAEFHHQFDRKNFGPLREIEKEFSEQDYLTVLKYFKKLNELIS